MSLMNLLTVLEQATPQEVIQGMGWYEQARAMARRLADRYGLSLDVVAGVIAALSPRSRWERNVVDAESLIAAYTVGEDPMAVPVTTFHRNKECAIRVLEVGTRHGVLSGFKVCSFADNIENPSGDPITVDSHSYNAWIGHRAISSGNGPRVTPKRYLECAEGYSKVADLYGIRPSQAQAIIWLAWKRIHQL